jgi:hypothetical protein
MMCAADPRHTSPTTTESSPLRYSGTALMPTEPTGHTRRLSCYHTASPRSIRQGLVCRFLLVVVEIAPRFVLVRGANRALGVFESLIHQVGGF